MDFDAFTDGVELGGLRTQSDIRLLVCYMIKSVPASLKIENINEILQLNGLANYFEISDAVNNLLKAGHIKENDEKFLEITDTGIEIAYNLETTLPLSIREKAINAAFDLLRHAKIEKENKVEIKKMKFGYNVTCHVSGGEFDLMQFTLYVPDLYQARMVKRNFHRDPEAFYKLMLSSITGNRDLAKSFEKW